MEFDKIDLKIIDLLQEDAKLSVKEIAEKVQLTSTPVFKRIKRLEKNKVIKAYAAIIDENKVRDSIVVFAQINLKSHAVKAIQEFERRIIATPEITECHHLTGESDYLLKIQVETMEAYRSFVIDKLSKLENIAHVNSAISFAEIKKKSKPFST